MTADEIARIIQLILAPVVMVTACAVTLGGLFNHSQGINDRLRAMAHERLDLCREGIGHDPLRGERLEEIDHQMPELLSRHALMRNAILSIQLAVALFVACMLAIAGASVTSQPSLAMLVLGLFLMGTLLLLLGVVLSALEVRRSHRALQYEVKRISGLTPPS